MASVRPAVRPAAKRRISGLAAPGGLAATGASGASAIGAAGLLVVGHSGPVQGPAEAAPSVRVRSVSPKPEYRAWATRSSSAASKKATPVTTSALGSEVTVSVVLALSGNSLATFPLSLESTAADVLQRLEAEAPLHDMQGYKLVINDEAFEGSRSLQSCCKDGHLEVAAFVVPAVSVKLSDHPAVRIALESFSTLEGHLSKPAHQRDWEFFDDVPPSVMLTIDAVCILLQIKKQGTAGGLYGDIAGMVQPLPLMDSKALAEFLSHAVVKAEDSAEILALLAPILTDPNYGEDAIRRWRQESSSASQTRVARTCTALSRWCTAAVDNLKSFEQASSSANF